MLRTAHPPGSNGALKILTHLSKKTLAHYRGGEIVFRESDPADTVFFIESGRIKVTRVSETGREAVVAVLGEGEFLGEASLLGQPLRVARAECIEDARLWRVERAQVVSLLHADPGFSEIFVAYLLTQNDRYQEDLANQLVNSTEKRLARALLVLAHLGAAESLRTIAPLSHQTLAEMIGTTRARVTFFMNRFRKQGFVEYDRRALRVHADLLKILGREPKRRLPRAA